MHAGDVIYTWKRQGIVRYRHFGVYCGNEIVIHHPGWLDGDVTGTIGRVSLTEFSCGAQPEVARFMPSECLPPEAVVQRAESRLGESSYHLLFGNCEHFVYWCKTGRSESPQVVAYSAATMAALCLGLGTTVLLAGLATSRSASA